MWFMEEPKEFTASQIRIAAYAGLFDGEGCIGMYKSRDAKRGQRWQYSISLRVGMTHRDTLARMAAVFGAGTVRTYGLRPGRQRSWMWFCGARKEVTRILQMIQPHLDVKAHEAKVALEYMTASELTDEQQDRYYRAMRMPKINRGNFSRNQYGTFEAMRSTDRKARKDRTKAQI